MYAQLVQEVESAVAQELPEGSLARRGAEPAMAPRRRQRPPGLGSVMGWRRDPGLLADADDIMHLHHTALMCKTEAERHRDTQRDTARHRDTQRDTETQRDG